jgi:hypothetical protein
MMDTDKMQKEQHNMDNDKFLNQINTQEDNLVKLIDRKLQELERLEKILEEGGELSTVYAEAFRLSGFDLIADMLDEYDNEDLFADRNNLGYLHVPLVNVKRTLLYFKDSYQILTLEFIRDVYKFNERNKRAHEEGREKISQEAIEKLDDRVLRILEIWRENYE